MILIYYGTCEKNWCLLVFANTGVRIVARARLRYTIACMYVYFTYHQVEKRLITKIQVNVCWRHSVSVDMIHKTFLEAI
jgi:hypothetical protein